MAPRQMGAILLLLIFTCHIQTILSAPLSSYLVSSFSSPDPNLPFNHIAINNATGDVYIGALERLYQLNSDLTLKHMVNVGTCSGQMNNDNELLLVAPSPVAKLITCGSCDGSCETRSLTNISHDVVRHNSTEDVLVVSTSNLPTAGVVDLGADIGRGTKDGTLYLFTGVSGSERPFISKRALEDLNIEQNILASTNTPENTFRKLIVYKDYLYYFMHRGNSAYLGRLCRNSFDSVFESYTEIQLQCSSYNMIQSAHIGPAGPKLADSLNININDTLVYVVFSNRISSALCVYPISVVKERFTNVVLGCIHGNTDISKENDYISSDVPGFRSICDSEPPIPIPDSFECSAVLRAGDLTFTTYQYASGTAPISASSIITIPDVVSSSIMTAFERDQTVVFIGDTEGNLHKANLVNSSFGYIYEKIMLGGGSVLQEIFLDESKEQITVATSSEQGSKVLVLELANCGVYQSCGECIGENGGNDGDPYCGWCTLEARCTRYNECPFSDESTRWLSYDALQCVSISDISPDYRLPYQQNEQKVNITIEKLPDLKETYQYQCAFDLYVVNAATTVNTVACQTPPANELPDIREGMDQVTLALSIVSTETDVNFVTMDFVLFDCSYFKSCMSCVSSPWSCDWCVYDNICTHDNNLCQPGDTVVTGNNSLIISENKGSEFCPQLIGTSHPFFIPVNIASGYSLLAKNLPTDQSKINSFQCILLIDDVQIRVPTTFRNDTYIVCRDEQYMYSENIIMKNVSVSVQWNGQNNIDDPSDTQVTLYKCSVNNGSCSRCLSHKASPSILKCGWCGDDCNVRQSDVCQNQFLSQNETQLCSAPVITEFYPLSAPTNGETRLEIRGTDLGVRFDDILRILIGEMECDVTGMESFYEPGQSVSCMTAISTELGSGRVQITVRSGEENRTGESTEDFYYRDPTISGFTPTEGQVAGGTEITITGISLNTGRNITARFGEAACNDLIVQDTVTTCTTSSMSMNVQIFASLTMTFDGVDKTFQDYTFTYKPNPIIGDIDRTKSIMSGGLGIRLTGERFDLIREPKIIVSSLTTNASNSELCNGTESILICPTPSFPDDVISSRRRKATDDAMIARLTFDFDGFIVDGGTIEYYPDPMYESFSGPNRIYESGNRRLEISGSNLDLASSEDDVQVLLGPDGACDVDDLEINIVRCQLPDKKTQAGNINGTVEAGPTQDLPAVTVLHGNLIFYPGYVKYSTSPINISLIVGIVCGVAVAMVVILVILGVIIFRRSHRKLNKQVQEFEKLEMKIQHRVETAFHELQADMSEVEEQISHLGVPFVNAQDYSRNMLFAGLAVLPPTTDPEYLNSDLERAMLTFSNQLSNPDFLIGFIKQLEEQRKSQRRDRVNIASLITVILVTEGKFGYFTDILFRLLEESIEDGAESGRAKALFRRTETIVEKLLSNWISICMYNFLKRHVAESLYLLYQSIKIQVEKGPIDITTGQSVFSLNFECLMEEEVEFNELTLSVVGTDKRHLYYVKVLDVDCITQVKQKILDAAYRQNHIVQQNRAHEMDLLWYHPGGEERVLKDRDEFNKTVGNTKDVIINTIATYGVTDSSQVALIAREAALNETGTYQPVIPGVQMFQQYHEYAGPDNVRDRDYIRIRTLGPGGARIIHLVSEDASPTESGNSLTRLDREFLAPRLLVTKKTIQSRLDEFLAGVFKKPDETPRTIKHLFDFFDKMADQYCSDKPDEIAEAWKNNCLPLHYWMTTLAHPSYVFDMRQSRSADQSVSVLANMLDNACKKVRAENTQVSALNRVLFYRDLPGHIKTIVEYYESIRGLQAPTPEQLQEDFQGITQNFSGLFSRVATLKNLYEFTSHDTGDLLDSITELMPN